MRITSLSIALSSFLCVAALALALPTAAHAQVSFPADSRFLPIRCAGAPMSDRFSDTPGSLDERDLVGDVVEPAGLRASDAQHLYLRLRLDEDPAPSGSVRAFAWGMQFDLDGDLGTYEVMVTADGLAGPAGVVSLHRNTLTATRNTPADPSDAPPVQTYPFAMNARSITAPRSTFGSSPDFFLDIAVPWSDLEPLGLRRDARAFVWAGSSSVATHLDGDLACHDGAGGAATLDGTASEETTGDPDLDPDGGPGGVGRLEGGGGCSAGGGLGGGAGGALLVLAGLRALLVRRTLLGARRRSVDR